MIRFHRICSRQQALYKPVQYYSIPCVLEIILKDGSEKLKQKQFMNCKLNPGDLTFVTQQAVNVELNRAWLIDVKVVLFRRMS